MIAHLEGKRIIIGISGSIAAYKAAFLTRLFIKNGAEVQIVMTSAATDFISPLTLSTLSKNPVHLDVTDGETWDNHVELGLWADLMIVAPATANTLAKMANGIADNMLVATYLSAKCPVFIAPAMDLDMWKHPTTINNLRLLREFNNQIIPVGHGELASGLVGDGRMAEPIDICRITSEFFSKQKDLDGKRILITAGPTQEAIDPVRFIGNKSSGKMGLALANECVHRGAIVDLVLGPVNLSPEGNLVQVHPVQSAQQMYDACKSLYKEADVAIFAAAVADYTPTYPSDKKIKKENNDQAWSLDLKRTIDIAQEMGKAKRKNQVNIGFALETDTEESNARKKLEKKNFDFIVMNSMADPGAGFQHDTNKITIYRPDGSKSAFSLKSKNEVAHDIVNELIKHLQKHEVV